MMSKKTRFNGFIASLFLSTSLKLYAFPTEPIDDICGPSEPPAYSQLTPESAHLKAAFQWPTPKEQWFKVGVGYCGSVDPLIVGVPFKVSSNLPNGTRCTYRWLVFEGVSSHAITSYRKGDDILEFKCSTNGIVESVTLPIQLFPIAAPTLTKR